ncbi:hypothetical protein RBB50_005423 [Rhinocladiella similis]
MDPESSSNIGGPIGAKSLQELSAEKTLNLLRKDRQAVVTFNSLDPDLQQILYERIWQDYIDLKGTITTYQKWCPAADQFLYTGYARGGLNGTTSDDSDDSPARKGFNHFRALWRYRRPSDPESPRLAMDDRFEWDSGYLYTAPGSRRDFAVCECQTSPGTCQCPGRRQDWSDRFTISKAISSQLLLYRLTVVFGMPPRDTYPDFVPGYKTCWRVELVPRGDGRDSALIDFQDWKGGVTVHFVGCQGASSHALNLLNWLVSDHVPHGYDNILAGTVA